MKKIDMAKALRLLAVFLFVAALVRMVYFTVAPALEMGFTLKPRAWFQVRFYLSQIIAALYQPALLLGIAELVQMKKDKEAL